MIALGLLFTMLMSAAVLVASASLASRVVSLSRGERALATSVLWNTLVLAPIHALGVTNALTPLSVAVAVLLLSAAAFVLSSSGTSYREQWKRTTDELASYVEGVWSLVVEGRSKGPLGTFAVAILVGALAWCITLVWLYPSESWDGVWYHDTMVGYAIQNHGYATITLPLTTDSALIQQANGYPRDSEMMSLWFVLFSDRRLLELPNTLAVLPLALGTYAFCRRYQKDDTGRGTAAAWAIALVVMPAVRLQMRTTYVDNYFAAFHVAAFFFCTHPRMNARIGLLAALALALTLGSKSMGLLSVPPLSLVAILFLALRGGLRGWKTTVAVAIGAAAIIVLFGGFTYLLNWARYQNPFFPVAVKLGQKTFPGPVPINWVDVNHSLSALLDNVMSVPVPGSDYADIKHGGYGPAVVFLTLPLAMFAFALASIKLVGQLFGNPRTFFRSLRASDNMDLNVVIVFVVAAFTLYKSPAIWAARYNVHVVAVFIAVAHAFASRWGRVGNFSAICAGTALSMHVMLWYWSKPGWQYDFDTVKLMTKRSEQERAATSLLLVKPTALARDKDLRSGDKVFWSDDLPFPSLLWNETFSNRLVYRAAWDGRSYVDAAEREDAKWIVVGQGSNALLTVLSRPHVWERVGLVHAHSQQPCYAYRRVGR